MTIGEFKAIIDRLHELHPEARMQFLYPRTYRGKRVSHLGFMTGYVVGGANPSPWVRIILEYASVEPVDEPAV